MKEPGIEKPTAAAMRAIRVNRRAHLKALTTGEGMGISTIQMALNIDREFRPALDALRRIADLPRQTSEAHTAANTAIEIARDALRVTAAEEGHRP